MSIWENILLALAGLKSSKMRSLLTMLGIIIGIGSVIGIVTVGNSLTKSVTGMMEEMGANQIYAYVSASEANSTKEPQDRDLITTAMVDEIQTVLGDKLLGAVVSQSAGGGQVKSGRQYANVNITGMNAGGVSQQKYTIINGHDITIREVIGSSRSAVVSDKFAAKIFPPGVNPIGQEIKVRSGSLGVEVFTITGVYEYKLAMFMSAFVQEGDMPTDVYIPVSTAQKIAGVSSGHSIVIFSFPPESDSYQVQTEINTFFAEKYRNNSQFAVYTQNMEGMMTQFTTMIGTLAVAISIIAAISLVVGGIGVMNIMLVSVTERTREIGTRKALGAKSSAIRSQFIIESMILCLIGGIIGVLMGLALGSIGSTILGFAASPSIPIIVIAVVFSMVIGVVFGVYPANKAAQLDPIEALRYE